MVSPRSAEVMAKLGSSPDNVAKLQADPIGTLNALAAQASAQVPRVLEQDKWIYRVVVLSLGVVAVVAAIGSIFLATQTVANVPVKMPESLIALGSASIGALAGLLAPSPARAS